jgi:hypothetical protein
METKGRRAPRAPEAATRVEPPKPVAAPAIPEGLAEAPTEPPQPAEPLTDAAQPAETALNLATAATSSPPAAGTAAKATKRTFPDDFSDFGHDAFAALAQSQAALARGLEALSAEMAGLALSGIDAASRTAAKMLEVKTLSDAIEVNTGFTCSSLDTLLGGSAKLSELGVKLAAETSQPILAQFGQGWIKASRFGS